jgi:hypothetical protein
VFATVDRDGDAGQEPVGERGQCRSRDVVGRADAPRGIDRRLGAEQRGLGGSESVVGAGVDGSWGDGIDPDRSQLDRQPGHDGVDGGVGGGDSDHARGRFQRGGARHEQE